MGKNVSRTSDDFELSIEIGENEYDFVQRVKEEHDTSSPRWAEAKWQWAQHEAKEKEAEKEKGKSGEELSLEKKIEHSRSPRGPTTVPSVFVGPSGKKIVNMRTEEHDDALKRDSNSPKTK